MNEQLSLLDLLIKKHHNLFQFPFNTNTFFHTLKIKYSLVFYENLTKKLKNRLKNFYFPAKTECLENGTSYIYMPIYGSYVLPHTARQ